MKQSELSRKTCPKKPYTAPVVRWVEFASEEGFATSFTSEDGASSGSSTGNQMQNFTTEAGSNQMYF